MNTHVFDGILKEYSQQILKNTHVLDCASFLDSSFYRYYLRFTDNNPHTNMITIINDYGTNANRDETNDYSCELILSKIVEISPEPSNDILDVFQTQLDEMSSGMCPQGRTHRLFQFCLILLF